ncbi:MAG: methyltransferase domain-containing protein [Myxococcales bacterium]|nr:class I SAM-dependent methyltransferase [Myxococcales bacterium]
MYFVDRCVVCDSGTLARWPAVTSPFVAEIAQWPAPVRCCLAECATCGHRFFDLRLDDAEMGKLYGRYRGDDYFATRHRWEPWYTRAVNDGIGHDPAEIALRRGYVLDFLRKHLPPKVFSGAVLDYGGDKGQFIPPELGAEKYVYEVSDQPPAEGVARLTDKESLQRGFDLVMLCHVLEHMSEPYKFLRELNVRAGWMYAEVPLERPRLLKLHADGASRGAPAAWIPRARPLWLGLDFYSTIFRVKLGLLPPLAPIKLHEHLNFFSRASLRKLFERAGFSVEACEEGAVAGASGISGVVKLLARSSA